MTNLEETVLPFYRECLTVRPGGDPAAVMRRILSNDFQSIGSVDVKTRDQLSAQIGFFWKLIPDLRWEVAEALPSSQDRLIVRSIASGTPKGDFMGLPTDGTRSFKIMTIDIHTVVSGRVSRVHHLEDWVTAMKQLKG